MIQAITESLPLATAVALSPGPVIAILIMLMTVRATTNAPSFLMGWILGILVIGLVIILIPGIETPKGEQTTGAAIARILIGVFLLYLAARRWLRQPGQDEPATPPKFLTSIDKMGVWQAFLLGLLFSGGNVKNMVLIAAGASTIDAAAADNGAAIMAFLVFTIISSLMVVFPIIVYLSIRDKAEALFQQSKDWLIRNNITILIILLLVFGVLLIGGGLRILNFIP